MVLHKEECCKSSPIRATEAAYAFIRSNEERFSERPKMVVGEKVVKIGFKVKEDILRDQGLFVYNHNAPGFCRFTVHKAYIYATAGVCGVTTYPGAASIIQYSLDNTIAAADILSSAASLWKFDVATLDCITGLSGFEKTLDVQVNFFEEYV